ncbi:transglutaminase family protein [Listeria sp. FSL L7-1485]|uniref:Transglutaminase family protein n=1 Tax=Listeria immobilis TaxID=2713502 RepID=A0A7X1C7S5_9LIST|nr:transglutaminase family protein [Listeria immobilis]MBC1487548.1 transglutaminase family protein [Listeria immobilis]MBC1506857.1 transglutaminase family protein [Listeria immobilis]MBC1509624.1 transglutaminase family protein [Listeria immobilis]MBC1534693.1 transglutaminase family protein [Listeria immobilis]MBC6296589.1 transglutaminase family protein [Listeria immobilis]
MEKNYYFVNSDLSSDKTKQENIDAWLKTQQTDFYQAQIAQERDYCFWCDMVETAKPNSRTSYTSMAYTLNDPNMLNSAAKSNFILAEDEVLYIHTLSVVRDGKVIDKLNDINVKVLDYVRDENQASFNDEKKVTVLIRDLHLNDIFIIETSTELKYQEDSIRNQFFRWIYTYPNSYWAYGKYRFELKNETGQQLEVNYNYFRDDEGKIIEKEREIVENQKSYVIEKNSYIGKDPNELELLPFIDFTTQKTYPEITKTVSDLYQKFYQVDVTDFAADFIAELDELPSLQHKIRHAIDFVQKEVYYLYNEAEMDGHEPQPAEVTYNTKQGDCKAKTLLLKVLLDYLGVDSEFILVSYDRDIFLPVYAPSPFNFNHAILKINYENQVYFVDATINNDQGFLENRQKNSFMYYLEIKEGTELQKQEPFQDQVPSVEEIVRCDVKENKGYVTFERKLRGRMANGSREMFKNDSIKDIINRYNFATYSNMTLYKKYEENEIDKYFSDESIKIVEDNKELNELSIIYKATISDPYIVENKNRFLHYWNWGNFIDDGAEKHFHKDFPYWVDRNVIKMEIHLTTDKSIDQQESFTRQECDINSKYLQHRVTKKIMKNGASTYLEYKPYHNLTISGEVLKDYVKVNKEILNSNWGIGIDIIEDSIFKKIGKLFK